MSLRRSISNTKKFFQSTIQSVKSLFTSSSYQRLPKTPPFKPFSSLACGGLDGNFSQMYYRELDKFYSDFANRWNGQIVDESEAAVKKRSGEVEVCNEDHKVEEKKGRLIVYEGKEKELIEISLSSSSSSDILLERKCLVEKKLKELEMMDLSNVENVLDIEEVLHYYSRLTCPVYVDVFDKFFIDMYSDLFNLQATVAHGRKTSSMPRLLYR